MRKKEPRKAEILLEYQNYIQAPPVQPNQMWNQACSSDGVTIDAWRNIWINNVTKNHEKFKSFKENSVAKVFGSQKYKPCIIVGSGPSLKYNADDLKDHGDIPVVSCLHNYHYLYEKGVKVDYWMTLDAGEVVIQEVSEGGTRPESEYWESTKDQTLVAFIGSSPKLFEKWQGKVLFFNAPVPDNEYIKTVEGLERFNTYISNGGNVLGACLYFAKAILGCNPIAFIGADFCFGYDKKFHSWDSKYDASLGYVLKAVDVYGNKVLTWQSYNNFKNWFDYIALQVPGIYVNCTEGGTFGAYPDGNLMAIKQMPLLDFLEMYRMFEEVRVSCEHPESEEKRILF